PSSCASVGARLCPVVSHRWVQSLSDRAAHPLRAVGTPTPSTRQRTRTQAALDAPARAPLCAGGQDRAAAPFGPRAAPGRVRHAGGGPADADGLRLADQHRLHRARQPEPPPACRRGRATGDHPLQGGGRPAAAARAVPYLLQFLLAPCELTPAPTVLMTMPSEG